MISPLRARSSKCSWVAQCGTRLELAISTRGASGVGLEDRHRFARLHQQGLIVFQLAQRLQDGVEGFPTARGLPAPAVDHQVLRALGHLRVQVVLDHAVSGFGEPGFAGELGAARGAHGAGQDISGRLLDPWMGLPKL